jgi:hypothetical protein
MNVDEGRECDHHEMCKTSLQVLSMILKDKNNHDVSAIFNKILSANPRKVLEAFIDIHGKSSFITCGCESSAPFFVIHKAGRERAPY